MQWGEIHPRTRATQLTDKADTLFEPTFSPADEASRKVVLGIAEELGLSSTPKKTEKVVVILSSLLWACEKLRRSGSKENLIGWSHDDKYWIGYPAVGKRTVNEVRQALIGKEWLTLHTPASFKTTMTVYQVQEALLSFTGNWIQSEKPTVAVKSVKAKIHITGDSVGGQKLSPAQAKKKFGTKLEVIQSRIKTLNDYWKEHPLIIEGNQYTSATRVFNDGRLDRGGRLYGGWVGLPPTTRLTGTIDSEPVAEIDLRAANLTLLTGMTGNTMQSTPFRDPYAFVDADRNQVKKVFLEVLGVGNAYKRRGTKDYTDTFGLGQFVPVRDKLIAEFPALKTLEAGVLDSNALAFRESEIIISTIEGLRSRGIPAYPMHDALICKGSDADNVAEALQEAFERDCGIRPALTIQTHEAEEVEILGCYTSR